MKRGFVITGTLFGLALILLISTNYILLTEKNSTDYLVLQVDAVQNRAVDVDRIITDALADDQCLALDGLLGDGKLDLDGIRVTHTSSDLLTTCPDPTITVQVDSTNVHKEFTYSP